MSTSYPGLGPQYFDAVGLLRKNTVVTSLRRFEEHPESYRPRVFVTVLDDPASTVSFLELLQDGQAVSWTRLPDPLTCGFDYWSIFTRPGAQGVLGNVSMVRRVSRDEFTKYPPSAEGEPDATQ